MKYPKYVVKDLGGLAEYLLQPPDQSELNSSGCLSKEACNSIDRLVVTDLQERIKHYQLPAKPGRGTNPNNRWRTVSCLQKAIRFGDPDMAQFAASALYDMDKKYLLRRLGVIAVEDVGMGSMYAMLAALAVAGCASWRKAVDERRLACFLADMQARAPKDRTICNLLVLVDYDTTLPKTIMTKWSSEKLRLFVEDEVQPLNLRMLSAWLMAGTKRFPGLSMPEENDRPPTELFRMMVDRKLSRAALYLAAKTASRLGQAMFVSFLFVDEWLRQTAALGVPMQIVPTPLPPTPKVGLLLSAAYDMYTREGRIALGKFKKENVKTLKPFLDRAAPRMADTLLHNGVFQVEGGVLARRMMYANSEPLSERAKVLELTYTGIEEELLTEYRAVLTSLLGELNLCREKVLYAMLHG